MSAPESTISTTEGSSTNNISLVTPQGIVDEKTDKTAAVNLPAQQQAETDVSVEVIVDDSAEKKRKLSDHSDKDGEGGGEDQGEEEDEYPSDNQDEESGSEDDAGGKVGDDAQVTKKARQPGRSKEEKAAEDWALMVEALNGFCEKHGHCNVPFFYETMLSNGKKCQLGFWLGTQRKYKKQGKLPAEHLAVLQAFVDQGKLKWSFRTNPLVQNPVTDAMGDAERWELMYTALVRYGEENGHCNVPHHIGFTLDEGGDSGPTSLVRLGFWLGTQRKYKKAGKLKPEYEARLHELVNEGKLKWSMRSKATKKRNFSLTGPNSIVPNPVQTQNHPHQQIQIHQTQQPTSSMILNMQPPIHGLMKQALSSQMQAQIHSHMQAAQAQLLQQAQLRNQTSQAYMQLQQAHMQEHQQRFQQQQQYQMQLQQQQQQQQKYQQQQQLQQQQLQQQQQLNQHQYQQQLQHQHMHQQQHMHHPSAVAFQRQAELQQSYLHSQIQAQIQAQLQAQMKAQMQAAQMHLPPGSMQHVQSQQQMMLNRADLLRHQHLSSLAPPQTSNVMIDDDGTVII